MEPVRVVRGTAVPLDRADVDTDQIIPASWLKRIERTGFGEGLFSAWRADPGFVLNRAEYDGARVLVAGPNFGSGSSREHAAWALQDYGFAAVISPRFADIFRGNSLKIGLLPVELPAEAVEKLMAAVTADPTIEVTVDLESRSVSAPAAGHRHIRLDAALSGQAFYERHGYHVTGRYQRKTRGGLIIPVVDMVKDLDSR